MLVWCALAVVIAGGIVVLLPYHRTRVDKVVGGWTDRASAPREPGKPLWPVECEIPWSVYRGVGGHYVVETATAQGWELRPSEPQTSVRLWWSAATRGEADASTAE